MLYTNSKGQQIAITAMPTMHIVNAVKKIKKDGGNLDLLAALESEMKGREDYLPPTEDLPKVNLPVSKKIEPPVTGNFEEMNDEF